MATTIAIAGIVVTPFAAAQPPDPTRAGVAWDWIGQPDQIQGTVAPGSKSELVSAVPVAFISPLPSYRVQALRSITFGERNDRPISIKGVSEWLPGSAGAWLLNSETAGVTGSTSDKTVEGPPGTVIQGLQVCQNDPHDPNERELKGLRIWVAKPDAQGKIPSIEGIMRLLSEHPSDASLAHDGLVSATRPSCSVWAKPVYCNANSAVIGLRAISTTAKGFQNVGIVCRRLFGPNEAFLPPVVVFPQTLTGTLDGATLTVNIKAGLDGNAVDTNGHFTAYVKDTMLRGDFSLTHQSGAPAIAVTTNHSPTWAALGCGPTTACDVTADVWESVSGALQTEYKIGPRPLHLTRPTVASGSK